MKQQIVIVYFVVLSLLLGCGEEFDEAADRAQLQQMAQDIITFVGEPLCQDSSDCRSIPLGVTPCGGPHRYIIYSAGSVDSVGLVARVSAYDAFNRELNERHGWDSDCLAVPRPKLGCRDGRCVDIGP